MNLDRLVLPNTHEGKVISECSDITEKALAETRTISQLLHPPLLDERGLYSAVRSFVEGFSRRSGLNVSLNLPSSLDPRLAPNLEIALFRSIQEGLTNVHRYANATMVNIGLTTDDHSVRLEICDNGGGMQPAVLERVREGTLEAGVGIAGMRERLRELSGVLEVQSDKSGTTLMIAVPSNAHCNEQVLLSASIQSH